MRLLLKILYLFLFISKQSLAQEVSPQFSTHDSKDSLAVYDKLLPSNKMKQDLDLFRKIREKANSGLYRYRTRQQIDSIYKWAENQIREPQPTTAFFKILLQLTDFEGSCHNYTELPEDLLNFLNRQKAFFPYSLKYIEGQMIFNNATDRIPAGSRIHAINGVSDTALMRSFYKYFPADGYTESEKLSASVNRSMGIRYLLEYGLRDSFVVNFSEPYSTHRKTVVLPGIYLQQRQKHLEERYSIGVDSILDFNKQPSHSFRMLNDSTALLNFRIFNMATGTEDPAFDNYVRFIDSVFKYIDENAVSNLIIDIRSNPGGSDPTFEQPMMYLTDTPFKENTLAYIIFDKVPYQKYFWGVSTSTKMSEEEMQQGIKMLKDRFPLLKDGRNIQNPKYNPVYHPKSPAFKGNLFLLIDEGVASAASHLASLVKAYGRNATIVGVETCGGYYAHNGHIPFVYQLPNSKIKSKFSIVYVEQDAPYKPDQHDGRGIIPDYQVWPSFEDFMSNTDTQMEFVLKLIRERPSMKEATDMQD